jgi:hypothetical protein
MSWLARFFLFMGLACAVSACSSSSSGSVPSGPNAGSTLITVTSGKGAPLGDLSVTLSTGIGNGGPTGIITYQRTNSAGQVTFSNLPSAGQLCVYSATTFNGIVYRASHCAYPFPSSYTLKFAFKP